MNYLPYQILILIAVICLGLGGFLFKKTKDFLKTGTVTDGTVIRYETSHGKNGQTYCPVIGYSDLNHQEHTFCNKIFSSAKPYEIGQQVEMVYNPENADKAKVISYWGLYRWTVILFAIAAPLLVIGGGFFLYVYTRS